MIQEFIDRFQTIKPELLTQFQQTEPDSYEDIFKQTMKLMFHNEEYDLPDHTRVHTINDGDYQGTLLFVIAAYGYQPDTYWSCKVSYGSCSGCDTYQAYTTDGDDPSESASEMVTMALHMIQAMRKVQ